jgi:hypothetical protein
MGPRARRRLVTGAVALVVIGAIAAGVVLLSGSSKQSQPGRPGEIPDFAHHYVGPTDARYDTNFRQVTFGMTPQQVLRIVGRPLKKVGACWQYRVNEHFSGGGQQSTWNADRLCFEFGHYAEKHTQTNGQWDYQPPLPSFTQ